jgi:hypothetical protein
LFDIAQPESADIIGVVRAGNSEISMAEIRHFAIKKSPKQHGQGNFLENPEKNCHILRKKRVMK